MAERGHRNRPRPAFASTWACKRALRRAGGVLEDLMMRPPATKDFRAEVIGNLASGRALSILGGSCRDFCRVGCLRVDCCRVGCR